MAKAFVSRPQLVRRLRKKYGSDAARVDEWFVKYAAARRRKLEAEYEIQRGHCAVCQQATWMHPDTGPRLRQATLEHVQPVSMGGTDNRRNLVMTCHDCNSRRGVVDLMVFYANWLATGRRKMVTGHVKPQKLRSDSDVARQDRMLAGFVILFHLVPGCYEECLRLFQSHLDQGQEQREQRLRDKRLAA